MDNRERKLSIERGPYGWTVKMAGTCLDMIYMTSVLVKNISVRTNMPLEYLLAAVAAGTKSAATAGITIDMEQLKKQRGEMEGQ